MISKTEQKRLEVQIEGPMIATIEISKQLLISWYGKDISKNEMLKTVVSEFDSCLADVCEKLKLT